MTMGSIATVTGTATTTEGEKKARNKVDERNESKAMIDNVRHMQAEIEGKNSTILEMGKTNRRLYAQNKCLRVELLERETETGSEKKTMIM